MKTDKSIHILLSLLLVIVCGTGYIFGQATATGTLQGTVVDKSQAVVVGAEVVATFKATGTTRTATTNDSGSYRFDFAQAGTYQVKISKKGFQSLVETTELLVGQTTSVNATLTPGAATEVVEVTGSAPLVDLTKTSVSQDFTPTEVSELPLVGRDAANLAYLAPGVKATDSYDPTKNRYAVLSINGSDGRNVNTTINGVDNKDNTVGGAVMQMPLEAIQEFQISTQRFSAENGRSQGGAINMITKAGTNDYHGSVFGYFRDSALDTDEKVANGDGTSSPNHPDYSRQFFGGSVGGPLKKISSSPSSPSSVSVRARDYLNRVRRILNSCSRSKVGSTHNPQKRFLVRSTSGATTAVWIGRLTTGTALTSATARRPMTA